MGVSGCGKTTVGTCLATRLGLHFVEGDSLHPAANFEKMAAGIPLQDEDRWPWLDTIAATIAVAATQNRGLVVSCSALKKIYRDRLRAAADGKLMFVFLHGSKELLAERMDARIGHFMPPSLLESQIATLEEPHDEDNVIAIEIAAPIENIVSAVMRELRIGQESL
ncbi:gluconokinase [Chelativorans sp. SCAU2101]|uniref:Gluconokinase n=1 Tax=Chelativorans petroleitrophicus TaxID=2975484 RepID=A0A9X2XBB5_9HYPH|nr:gluconokinase [Chelativorans petroleitrophicus]MCT8992263.1 gluconokinase [Chelativorans petroleitrophicus]